MSYMMYHSAKTLDQRLMDGILLVVYSISMKFVMYVL